MASTTDTAPDTAVSDPIVDVPHGSVFVLPTRPTATPAAPPYPHHRVDARLTVPDPADAPARTASNVVVVLVDDRATELRLQATRLEQQASEHAAVAAELLADARTRRAEAQRLVAALAAMGDAR